MFTLRFGVIDRLRARRKLQGVIAALAYLSVAVGPAIGRTENGSGPVIDSSRASNSERESALDQFHDWFYQAIQHRIERLDTWFTESAQSALPVPPSSLRFGFESAVFDSASGVGTIGRPSVEGVVRLPNLERRLRLFITSLDVQESPADPTRQSNPIRLGVRVAPIAQLSFDMGVRAAVRPSAFATLKWAPEIGGRWLTARPFAKLYAESRNGTGISAGVMLQRLQGHWIARSSTYNNWLRSFSGVSSANWSQTFIAGRSGAYFPEPRYGSVADGRDIACGLLLRLYASGNNDARASTYEVSGILKRPLNKGWLFGYVEPVLRWDIGQRWHPDKGIRLGVEALFTSGTGRIACP